MQHKNNIIQEKITTLQLWSLCNMFCGLSQFHLSSIQSKLQGADGLSHVGFKGTDIHKHTSLQYLQNNTNGRVNATIITSLYVQWLLWTVTVTCSRKRDPWVYRPWQIMLKFLPIFIHQFSTHFAFYCTFLLFIVPILLFNLTHFSWLPSIGN